jgi:hypothetical protein
MNYPINDQQTLKSAASEFGGSIPVYDDGFGPLFIHRDSLGISGIVRAQTWEDAYSICEDEFFPEASETVEELQKEYGFRREHVRVLDPQGNFIRWDTTETPDPEAWTENELFQEAYGFRPNGPNGRDKIGHGIYAKDLNGDSLELLTTDLAADLGITLGITE